MDLGTTLATAIDVTPVKQLETAASDALPIGANFDVPSANEPQEWLPLWGAAISP